MSNAGLHAITRVLFVDDSVELQSAWARLLAREPDLKLVGSLLHLSGLAQAVRDLTPDVIVLDASIGDADGLAAISEINAIAPKVRVVIYSGRADPLLVERARTAGAVRFIRKHDEPRMLLAAIREAAQAGQASPADH